MPGQALRPVAGTLADGTVCYAPVGELIVEDSLVACHLCGRSFRSVSAHLVAHGWTKQQYCEAFGLERGQSLEGPETRKLRAAAFTARLLFEPRVRQGARRGASGPGPETWRGTRPQPPAAARSRSSAAGRQRERARRCCLLLRPSQARIRSAASWPPWQPTWRSGMATPTSGPSSSPGSAAAPAWRPLAGMRDCTKTGYPAISAASIRPRRRPPARSRWLGSTSAGTRRCGCSDIPMSAPTCASGTLSSIRR
jgi:hypothetical protein